MPQFRVVITDHGYVTDEYERSQVEPVGGEIVHLNATTEDEVIAGAADADGIINRTAPMTRRVIESLEKCKVISRYGVGVDNVDVQACTDHGIILANVPDYCLCEVADHAFALILTCARKTAFHDRRVRAGEWDIASADPVYRLTGKTLGLLGLGHIAQTLVQRVGGFGFRTIAFDPYIPSSVAEDLGVQLVALPTLLKESDFVSVHAPLTDETRHIVAEAELRMMKPTAVLVNTSRGPLVSQDALVKALTEGWLAAAGIDVYEQEPPAADCPLKQLDNVVLTDHAGWYSEEAVVELQTKCARQVALVLAGKWPEYVVNKDVMEKVTLAP